MRRAAPRRRGGLGGRACTHRLRDAGIASRTGRPGCDAVAGRTRRDAVLPAARIPVRARGARDPARRRRRPRGARRSRRRGVPPGAPRQPPGRDDRRDAQPRPAAVRRPALDSVAARAGGRRPAGAGAAEDRRRSLAGLALRRRRRLRHRRGTDRAALRDRGAARDVGCPLPGHLGSRGSLGAGGGRAGRSPRRPGFRALHAGCRRTRGRGPSRGRAARLRDRRAPLADGVDAPSRARQSRLRPRRPRGRRAGLSIGDRACARRRGRAQQSRVGAARARLSRRGPPRDRDGRRRWPTGGPHEAAVAATRHEIDAAIGPDAPGCPPDPGPAHSPP